MKGVLNLARPCKSAKVLTDSSQTKDEIEERIDFEDKLKGKNDNLIPPKYLTEQQKFIFNFIIEELKASGILGNLDVYMLTKGSIAIDRIQWLESKVNKNLSLTFNKDFISTKKAYDADFYRCCNELSLSPQSRAKLSNINLQAKTNEEDPLLKILGK